MYSPKRRFRLFRAIGPPAPPAGSGNDVLSFARTLATTYVGSDVTPTDGGALTLNSESVGKYEVTARKANTTISSFTASDWFTNTKDTTSSWIIINGNLTINSGQTLIPPVRKLFTVVYVTGNLTLNGTISMTARGANHSGTGDSGGATTAVAIRIGTGTFSAVSNPQIPATGGAGATSVTYPSSPNYRNGTAGTNGGSGGGGTGEAFGSGGVANAGAAGTCFSGGAGSGGAYSTTSGAGGANGGAGGAGGGIITGGGTGNPGGAKGSGGVDGNNGTGGTLIVIVAGSLSGSGTITAHGVGGARPSGSPGGGGSGGGSATVLYGSNPSSAVTVTATGGAGLASGNGGDGTARKLAIGAN
jgi:hypothetical protein